MTLKEGIVRLKEGKNLTQEESYQIFKSLATEDFSHEDAEVFLDLLKKKGETWQEIAGAILAYREVMTKLPFSLPEGAVLVDTCGTGGDAKNSFNFSTAVAIALSAIDGIYVAKHGNRSVSSQSGSADLIEASGIPLDLPPEVSAQALKDLKFTFLFAPLYHPAFKKVIPIRQKLGRTIFNLLGPLLNPASPTHQLMGVYSYVMTEKIGYVLDAIGVKRALIVFGEEGFDEITITGSTKVSELRDERITTYFLDPEDFGFERCENLEELQVKGPKHSLEILEKLFKNKLEGPIKDMFLMNLGAAIYLCEKAIDIKGGIEKAKELLNSGQVWEKFQEIKDYYKKLKN
ncbi:anthranilate phosphoribosyltransferase [Thermodesulfobacterium sp. TA1]|uniref:anthranilate phosphoribosyltransferase n=1 Tax=Thermodesulfobacterium sp. TA1 TaxID=2234087 RepID=UPI001231D38C|nr:anthranilate phosphoribosyltransferase [Thermodesulfobacterium sp. TA1]QER41210.1 anthranilate phosphoribosyltransferase [Thermodesulfobacterium sp. TA1]